MTEKELVVKFRAEFEAVNKIEEDLERAKSALEATKQQILDMFEREEKERTGTFEGVGFITRTKPRLYASCNEENKPKLLEHLESEGRTDLIKPTVAPATLSSYVSELLENGKPVPECIGYILKPGVRLFVK